MKPAVSKPNPRGEGLNGEFYRACAGGSLCFQRCSSCDAWRHLPRYRCPTCGSAEFRWAESTGRGRLYSWTVTHRAIHPAFADALPLAIVVVEMDEGVRIVSDLPGVDPKQLVLDLRVEAYVEVRSEEIGLPHFRLCADAA